MKKINVTFEVYEETLLKSTGAITPEVGIKGLLGLLRDRGFPANGWAYIPNELTVIFELYEEDVLKSTGASTLEVGINIVFGWLRDHGIYATGWQFVEE